MLMEVFEDGYNKALKDLYKKVKEETDNTGWYSRGYFLARIKELEDKQKREINYKGDKNE